MYFRYFSLILFILIIFLSFWFFNNLLKFSTLLLIYFFVFNIFSNSSSLLSILMFSILFPKMFFSLYFSINISWYFLFKLYSTRTKSQILKFSKDEEYSLNDYQGAFIEEKYLPCFFNTFACLTGFFIGVPN